VEESWEQGKYGEDVELGYGHHFCGVEVVPVAKFMGYYFDVILIEGMRRKVYEKDIPRTASTSSGLLCWMSVSKMTMCLL
jgi:hypothetical protein